MLADRRYGYLLTVTNHASRYLLVCEAIESNAEKPAFTALEHPFREAGLPQDIRSYDGVPLASPTVCSTSPRVSVLWLRLGISLERIKPGHSQHNSRHERRQPQPAGPISYTSRPSSTISSKSSTIRRLIQHIFHRPGGGR
jgi:putative transposase